MLQRLKDDKRARKEKLKREKLEK